MTLEDFEWVEHGFDTWYLLHKAYDYAVAKVYQYNGWHVLINQTGPGDELVVESFDAAKTIAVLQAAQHIEEYDHALRNGYRKRTFATQSKKIPKGVFKVDNLRA